MSDMSSHRSLRWPQMVVSAAVTAGLLFGAYSWDRAGRAADTGGNFTIAMTDYRFSPSHMVWRVGERVTITLLDESEARPPKPHEFMVGQAPRTEKTVFGVRQEDGFEKPFFTGVTIEIVAGSGVQMLMPGGAKFTGLSPMQVMQPSPGGMGDMHDMSMEGFMPVVGAKGRLVFSFIVPDRPGDWTFGCFQQSGQHYLNGMKGTITVLPKAA